MPRPGPRPYECVKKAWHSSRHQPIRGTIIQEIFRVVNEIHSSATKKNREWQDKLPAVVLRVEEIMYSKANSEAEYVDLNTIWNRANDAINVIIRRDESTETNGLLQPCIEAALNLGCVPRKASRSQRNSSPRSYLNSGTQEPPSVPPGIMENKAWKNHTHWGLECQDSDALNNFHGCVKFPFSLEDACASAGKQCLSMETNPASSMCTVYPLYFGNGLQIDGSIELSSKPVEPDEVSRHKNGSDESTKADSRVISENPIEDGCDLSLHLGPFSVPCSVESRWPQVAEYVSRGKQV